MKAYHAHMKMLHTQICVNQDMQPILEWQQHYPIGLTLDACLKIFSKTQELQVWDCANTMMEAIQEGNMTDDHKLSLMANTESHYAECRLEAYEWVMK